MTTRLFAIVVFSVGLLLVAVMEALSRRTRVPSLGETGPAVAVFCQR